ncbi:hypothetical protein [Georgenia muralis]|uniref:Dolichyl-phosphate-mannose-protein mannosyltransferase n=1 Tax=Georgenia muralis TaxID=154117 RepID=A0A3N4Z1H6_9MICO|nr:hypothetical protein [Georgenia muralis]RPF26383.1 hypothetical protein EDD32_0822 [Georgenia muralis]
MIGQLGTAVLLVGAVVALGLAVVAGLRERLHVPTVTRAALVPLAGLAVVGIATLLVGHVGLLGAWLPFGLAAAGTVTAVAARRPVGVLLAELVVGARAQVRLTPVPVLAVAAGLGVAAIAALAPPLRIDELEYHWAAPVEWAAAGSWNDSPYKHVDGFPFMEIVYTAAATQGSYVAAHLLHLLTLPALGLAAAGAARVMGVRATGAVAAAAMAMPVVWDQAYTAYNDTAASAFAAAAVALALATAAPAGTLAATVRAGPTGVRTAGRTLTTGLVATSVLLAVAISIKPTSAAAAGAVGLALLLRWWAEAHRPAGAYRTVVRQWLVLGATAVLTLGFWSVRQWLITGYLVDPALGATPSVDVLSRLPSRTDQLLVPVMPLVTGLVGSQEPWGGRTSLVVQLLLVPALAYVLWRRGTVLRRFTLLGATAWVHWLVLGTQVVRTRFHGLSWVLLVGAVRVALEDAAERHPRWRPWLEIAWAGGVLLGLADVSFEMVRAIAQI